MPIKLPMTTDSLDAYFAQHKQRLECFLKDAIDLPFENNRQTSGRQAIARFTSLQLFRWRETYSRYASLYGSSGLQRI